MKLLLKNGSALMNGQWEDLDILIEDNLISKIQKNISPASAVKTIDLKNQKIIPGLIDVHVHLRTPGQEHKETIATGTMSAAHGGFTTIACMPNTSPALDHLEVIKKLKDQIHAKAHVNVKIIGAISKNRKGIELTNFAELKDEVIGFSDDGDGVQSGEFMREAFILAKKVGRPIMAHCEDCKLSNKGIFHDGEFSKRHKLPGISSASEFTQVERDIKICEEIGTHYHICHISTKESVQMVREAKAKGINVTCEVTPHHLLLTDEMIPLPDSAYKMNPPLRAHDDREALVQGLIDGTIDIIATDHAPHTEEEKAQPLSCAPFGVIGLDFAFSLLHHYFVRSGLITLEHLLHAMIIRPAKLFHLDAGELAVGKVANLTILDLNLEMTLTKEMILSLSKNTPFLGRTLTGWPVATIVNGKIIWSRHEHVKMLS